MGRTNVIINRLAREFRHSFAEMDQLCPFQSGLEQHACEESKGKSQSNTAVFSCCFLSASDSTKTTHSPLSLLSLTVTTAGTTPFTFHVALTPQSPRHTARHTHMFLIPSLLLETSFHRKVFSRDLSPRTRGSQHSTQLPNFELVSLCLRTRNFFRLGLLH